MVLALPAVANQLIVMFLAGVLALSPLQKITIEHTPEIVTECSVYEQDGQLLIIDQIEDGSQVVLLAEQDGKITEKIVVKKTGKVQTVNPKTGKIDELTTSEETVIEKWTAAPSAKVKVSEEVAKQGGIVKRAFKKAFHVTGKALQHIGNVMVGSVKVN